MNIVIVDGQVITRVGLRELFTEIPDIRVVVSTDDYRQADAIIKELKPQLLVIDPFFTPDFSLEDLLVLKSTHTKLKVMVISANRQPVNVIKLMGMGIKNHLSKDASKEEILTAIQHIHRDEKFLCSRTDQMLSGTIQIDAKAAASELSQREKEIIHLIAEGRSDKAIAEELYLSFHTIRTHRKNIARKLGFSLKNAAELVLLINYMNDVI
ncbi:response regulator transcription factor [Mucilaginibacter agri]|uniref:Response regulator n=1 Tax=Mucilaginibacter agri TaxID=2695265 RepID=A0A965ZF05_9SPHI|nr:response regulator transcription factor [Mucilaginibacter agri]NCD68552.1 response regulator [Mucilaginibacter agri]